MYEDLVYLILSTPVISSLFSELTREQLIQLALLVGSDYTCGIQGVGPVTALEIVAAFHTNSEPDPVQSTLKGLSKFKDWWTAGRPHQSNRLRLLDKKLKNVNFLDGTFDLKEPITFNLVLSHHMHMEPVYTMQCLSLKFEFTRFSKQSCC